MGDKGWLVSEFRVGVGEATHTKDPLVFIDMKMAELPDMGTYILMPDDALKMAESLTAAANKAKENGDDPGRKA